MLASGTGDQSEACKPSNAKLQGRTATVRKAALLKNKWNPC